MFTSLVTAPTQEPISLDDAKEYLRVDGTADDNQITGLIKAATAMVEQFLDKKLITQTWAIYYDHFSHPKNHMWWDGVRDTSINELVSNQRWLDLPLGPMQSVTSFKTYDNDNTAIVENLSNYIIDNKGPYGRLSLKYGAIWPTTILRPVNGIEVVAVFGYGDDETLIPDAILFAIKQTVAFLYENRGDVANKMPSTIEQMLTPYKRIKVARGGR